MKLLLHGDCLEQLSQVEDNSIDFIFCDLPYGQTSCKWDIIIPWEPFWKEIMRVKKINTPIFMTTTTKFGVQIINSAPKKCPFRYDLVWVKSAPAGFLSAKKMPMRKHEMVYVFYEKLPFYDLSSHSHKFLKPRPAVKKGEHIYGDSVESDKKTYDPPLPVSVIKGENNTYNTEGRKKPIVREKAGKYDPPLPVSVVKEETGGATGEELDEKYKNKGGLYSKVSRNGLLKSEPHYDPPLPVSVVKEEGQINNYIAKRVIYKDENGNKIKEGQSGKDQTKYDPPLPVSVVKEEYNTKEGIIYNGGKPLPINDYSSNGRKGSESAYDPPLPTTMLEIKSTRGKHSTEKPVALMEWLLKYFSKEGDTVLDPTMGSGSTGVACKNMNRNFIGIEKDAEIYEVAVNRIEG